MADGLINEVSHPSDRCFHPHEHRAAHDAVPDVELLGLADGGDGLDVPVREAGAGVDGEARGPGVGGGPAQPRQGAVALAPRVSVAAGVQLDGRYPERVRQVDRGPVGVDEQADADPGALKTANRVADLGVAGPERETALGGDLLTPLRDERGLERLHAARDADDLAMGAELEVEDGGDAAGERADVRVLDVAAVLAQMDGDAVGTAALGGLGGARGIRLVGAARLPQGCHVINVDVEAHGVLPSGRSTHRQRALLMRRYAVLATLLAVACGHGSQAPVPQTLSQALDQFLAAVKANDL